MLEKKVTSIWWKKSLMAARSFFRIFIDDSIA